MPGGEEPLVGLGQGMRRGGGQHPHELVKGLEGLAQLKLDVQLPDAMHVCGGGVVKRVSVSGWVGAWVGVEAAQGPDAKSD